MSMFQFLFNCYRECHEKLVLREFKEYMWSTGKGMSEQNCRGRCNWLITQQQNHHGSGITLFYQARKIITPY